jgi:hypothetical protein
VNILKPLHITRITEQGLGLPTWLSSKLLWSKFARPRTVIPLIVDRIFAVSDYSASHSRFFSENSKEQFKFSRWLTIAVGHYTGSADSNHELQRTRNLAADPNCYVMT